LVLTSIRMAPPMKGSIIMELDTVSDARFGLTDLHMKGIGSMTNVMVKVD
jgi:hypothetical protein